MALLTGHDLTTVQTLMGWNQLVEIDLGGGYLPLRVSDFNMGSKQEGDAPDYVTGASDRTAWTKGPVTTEGNISYPFTFYDGGTTLSGIEMFQEAANLAANPGESFQVKCSATNDNVDMIEFDGCKIQTSEIRCDAEGVIECSSNIWGIAETLENVSGGTITRTLLNNLGIPAGSTDGHDELTTVQIPMWDACEIIGAPDGMYVVGFSLQIDNQLQRNYTMGTQLGQSPYGLNASSISAGQRRVTGTITWQSDAVGLLSAIMGTGIEALQINIGSGVVLDLTRCLWNAVPPSISPGDRITCESSFVALGSGSSDEGGFDALVITSS